MIDRVYNKKNKTNESGKNSLSDLSLSVFAEFEENNRSSQKNKCICKSNSKPSDRSVNVVESDEKWK